jgi:hypothetical protein
VSGKPGSPTPVDHSYDGPIERDLTMHLNKKRAIVGIAAATTLALAPTAVASAATPDTVRTAATFATTLTPFPQCTTRSQYSNGINVTNDSCGSVVWVSVQWIRNGQNYETGCYSIQQSTTRPYPKPAPGYVYVTIHKCK